MKNIANVLKIFFKRVPSKGILSGEIDCRAFTETEFERISFHYLKNYSETELANMWQYLKDTFEDFRKDELYQKGRQEPGSGIRVFDVVFYCADLFLTTDRNQAVCRYLDLLRWRDVILEVSEDLLVSAYWAKRRDREQMRKIGFSWPLVTGHNGHQLNRMMQRKISENHFHLYGSAPVFHISWLSLMNDLRNTEVITRLEKYNMERRYANIHYSGNYGEDSLIIQYYQAALIRLYLFAELEGIQFQIGSYLVSMPEVSSIIGKEEVGSLCGFYADKTIDVQMLKKSAAETTDNSGRFLVAELFGRVLGRLKKSMPRDALPGNVFLKGGEPGDNEGMEEVKRKLGLVFGVTKCPEKLLDQMGEKCTFAGLVTQLLPLVEAIDLGLLKQVFHLPKRFHQALHQKKTMDNVMEILRNQYSLCDSVAELQQYVDAYCSSRGNAGLHGGGLVDYALLGAGEEAYEEGSCNYVFAGERWFIYSWLRRIWLNTAKADEENLFYTYILIKETIRSELLQSNKNVGFDNFQRYERRKLELVRNPIYRQEAVRHAVRGNMLMGNIRSFEIRISPKKTMRENVENIKALDRIIGGDKKTYFYTLHFIKEDDEAPGSAWELERCRHHHLREQSKRTAQGLVSLRENYPKTAQRILGIDAASQEIGCRPEVFAVPFRYLKSHIHVFDDGMVKQALPQVRATYHVGEDFLDLVDGLRAIDEAINFLGLDCGDRLGHALALGIDVDDWYVSKGSRIYLPLQDYLDNLAWMYNRLVNFQVTGMDVLRDHIEKRFDRYFNELYVSHMDMGEQQRIMERAAADQVIPPGNANGSYSYVFDIFSYYDAWTLRGDDPSVYADGYYKPDDDGFSIRHYEVNKGFPKHGGGLRTGNIRKKPEVALLYYYYHFNSQIKAAGSRRVQVEVRPFYVEGVKAIQRKMQEQVARLGIAIETNPSSNYLIGTFKDYRKHPIVNFYNKGLVYSREELDRCAQIPVSINTDDLGVFSTSLENEYALMACALETAEDANGKKVYDRINIYDWLDAVRKMGNDQSFQWALDNHLKLRDD